MINISLVSIRSDFVMHNFLHMSGENVTMGPLFLINRHLRNYKRYLLYVVLIKTRDVQIVQSWFSFTAKELRARNSSHTRCIPIFLHQSLKPNTYLILAKKVRSLIWSILFVPLFFSCCQRYRRWNPWRTNGLCLQRHGLGSFVSKGQWSHQSDQSELRKILHRSLQW